MLNINKDPGIFGDYFPKKSRAKHPKIGIPEKSHSKATFFGILKRVLLKITVETDFQLEDYHHN